MSKDKPELKIYEYVGYCKWAITVAANSEAEADAAVEALDRDGNTWANVAAEIGFDVASDLELVDVRPTTRAQRRDPELLSEAVHIVATPKESEPTDDDKIAILEALGWDYAESSDGTGDIFLYWDDPSRDMPEWCTGNVTSCECLEVVWGWYVEFKRATTPGEREGEE